MNGMFIRRGIRGLWGELGCDCENGGLLRLGWFWFWFCRKQGEPKETECGSHRGVRWMMMVSQFLSSQRPHTEHAHAEKGKRQKSDEVVRSEVLPRNKVWLIG